MSSDARTTRDCVILVALEVIHLERPQKMINFARQIRRIGRKLCIINIHKTGLLFNRVETDFSKFYIYLFIYLLNHLSIY